MARTALLTTEGHRDLLVIREGGRIEPFNFSVAYPEPYVPRALTFEIAEVNVVSSNWAFLRSTSNGSITILASGAQIPSSNHELFVLHKSQGSWKLARYSFSSVLPSA